MSNLLDAVNVSTNKDEFLIGKLPTEPGEVSIMTLEQVYDALGGSSCDAYDPSYGYNTSTYYVYAVSDAVDRNDLISVSTLANLQNIDIDWYKQLNKPDDINNHWTVGSYKVFGGPLQYVNYDGGYYRFYWYNSESSHSYSDDKYYWGSYVTRSVCVAVVCAHE